MSCEGAHFAEEMLGSVLHAAVVVAWLCGSASALIPSTLRRSVSVTPSSLRRPLPSSSRVVSMMSEQERQKKGKLKTIVKDRVDAAAKTKPKEKLDTEGYWCVANTLHFPEPIDSPSC